MSKNAIVYIDGFNLYYGAMINKPQYKWLDILKLSEKLLYSENVIQVKYFTATVKRLGDSGRPIRQNLYWRALKAKGGKKINIIKGYFRVDPKRMPIALYQDHIDNLPDNITKNKATRTSIFAMKTEEKGSDVNLATHLLNDAWSNKYDVALVISNDTDLAEAIRLSKKVRNKKILVATPFIFNNSKLHKKLEIVSSKEIIIKEKNLRDCQLPPELKDHEGKKITRPIKWN